MRKAEELEAELGHAPPRAQGGYLAQGGNVSLPPAGEGYMKTQYDPRGLMDKKPGKSFNPNSEGGKQFLFDSKMRETAKSDSPWATFARGYIKDLDARRRAPESQSKDLYSGAISPYAQLIPNAPVESKSGDPRRYVNETFNNEVVGLTERGEPIYASTPGYSIQDRYRSIPAAQAAVKENRGKRGKKTILQLNYENDPAVGFNKRGEAVTVRGKNLGYLGEPALVTPRGEIPMRSGERRKSDILFDKDGNLMDKDKFGADALQQIYGDDLKVMQENRDENGMPTDKFPRGYLDHLQPEQRENILKGVRALQKLERGTGA
jgi:hypothetical protein